jgi:DNA uptake protein ComE-like DNA-binding protein
MANKVRINLANRAELLELGLTPPQAEAVVRHRAEHGPIKDARELADLVGGSRLAGSVTDRVDFAPADSTAPEAPGA